MQPIGYIQSPYKERGQAPRQGMYAQDVTATLEMLPEFREGIRDIQPGTYGVILFYFHKSEGYRLLVRPHGVGDEVGVFSTRSPNRPNGIGMSVVKFVENDGERLVFEGADMLDGTPVLDIKPYVKMRDEAE
ncbi:MAG: tRNA (N6-threonylcarbamoyladenosine(37)-N6)-methyltransferase TrmO [Anaerofustis sp.]